LKRFWLAWSAHFIEAVYVAKVASNLGLRASCVVLWFIQTICFGYASTGLILKYRNKIAKLKGQ